MLLKIDRERPEPLYRQVISGIRALVENGTLEAGRPLPSSRRRRLGIFPALHRPHGRGGNP